MGGTTAKFCIIDQGKPLIAHEFEVDRRYRFKKGSGLPIKAPVIEMIEIVPLAYDVFGQELVEQAIQSVFALLQGWGYSLKERQNPAACLAYLLLRNENPSLSHLSFELLVEVSQTCQLACVQQSLFRISRALLSLNAAAFLLVWKSMV